MNTNDFIIIRLLDQIAVLVSNKTSQHYPKIAAALSEIADQLDDEWRSKQTTKIQNLRSGDTVTALIDGSIAVKGATYEVSEIRLRDGYIGLTLLKPNRDLAKEAWCSFDVSGNNLSELFKVN